MRFKLGIIFFFCLMSLSSSSLLAQRQANESVLTASVGYSIWNFIGQLTDSIDVKSTPTFDATYDYAIVGNVTLGGAVSYNTFSFINPNYSYINSARTIVYESISVKYSLVNVALRPVVRWGKNDDLEWFAGLRLGYSFWDAKIETSDPYYQDEYARETNYSIQAIGGLRAWVSDYVGLTFDVGIGTPYFASMGVSLKL